MRAFFFFAHMYVCALCVYPKRPEVELGMQMAVSHHVGSRNRTQVHGVILATEPSCQSQGMTF